MHMQLLYLLSQKIPKAKLVVGAYLVVKSHKIHDAKFKALFIGSTLQPEEFLPE